MLLISGTCGMAIALLTIALIFLASGPQLSTAAAIAAVAALFVYIGSFAIGLGPVFWLLISEIYPVRVRASAMSAAACANWAANFVVTISFLTLLNAITDAGTFFLFAFLTTAALGYFWQRVPETRGLQLDDISAGRGRDGTARRRAGMRSWTGGGRHADLAGSSRALAGGAQLLTVHHDPFGCPTRRPGVGSGGRPDAVSVPHSATGPADAALAASSTHRKSSPKRGSSLPVFRICRSTRTENGARSHSARSRPAG